MKIELEQFVTLNFTIEILNHKVYNISILIFLESQEIPSEKLL
jgi:hypothetical protein